jgi:hypothetical protein
MTLKEVLEAFLEFREEVILRAPPSTSPRPASGRTILVGLASPSPTSTR